MRIVYIVSADKSPKVLIRWVRRLHTPASTFLFHVDKRTNDKQYREMVSDLNHLGNVVFLAANSI
jgi:hypothetical protein